jgi:integrase
LPYPREESPARPVLSRDDYTKLQAVAEQVHEYFGLALVLAHETGHRISSIRQLRWSDIDFDKGSIRGGAPRRTRLASSTNPQPPRRR